MIQDQPERITGASGCCFYGDSWKSGIPRIQLGATRRGSRLVEPSSGTTLATPPMRAADDYGPCGAAPGCSDGSRLEPEFKMTQLSRGDKTAIELFMAGIRGWEAGLRRRLNDGR